MRNLTGILLLLLTLVGNSPGLQKQNDQPKNEFFVEPRESSLPLVVRQLNCPLEFDNLEFFHHTGGGGAGNYTVRNSSQKPIIKFAIATIGFGGGGSLDEITAASRSEWLMPGESWPRRRGGNSSRMVPLTDKLRKQYKVGPPMKAIVMYLVVRAEFADGSTYSDELVYKELKKLFEDIVPPNR